MTASPLETFRPTPFGNYLLVERIGAGGMAEIFRAKTFGAAGFEKEYAIKRILPNLGIDHEFVSMFVNEAKLVVDLYHPNIVQVFDLGQIEGAFFIAMEFVQGRDLLDLLARCAENDLKIPLKLSLFVMMEMLKGLDFAHQAKDRSGEDLNIIHRDVSPSNIMLSYTGHVKIGDFGVAKARTQRRMTEVGTLKGKVGYMSPEQVRGDEIDHRSDVFAAGIILYESLTMSRLFIGGNDLDVMLKIRDSDIGEDLARCRKVPPSLLKILHQALAKDLDDRYQTCEAFHADIQDFVYRHDIKTNNTDLSAFLHRVFQEEIRAEKARRMEDPSYPMAQLIQQTSSTIAAPSGEARIKAETGPRVASPPKAEKESPLSRVDRAPQPPIPLDLPPVKPEELVYRYRGPFGREYGPMTLDELLNFLAERIPNKRERIAIHTGIWRPIGEFPELAEASRQSGEEFAQIATLTGTDSLPLRDDATGKVKRPQTQDTEIDLEGTSPTHQGRLGRITLARLLFRLARRRRSGKFQVEVDEHHKELYLRKGEPVVVTSSMPEELLGNFLVRRQIITAQQLQTALDRATEYGGRLGDALVGARILTTHDLFHHLSEQLVDRLLNLFTWSSGEWSWFPDTKPPYQAVPLGVDPFEIILEGIRNRLPPAIIRNYFADREQTPLQVCHSRITLEDLPLLSTEAELAREVGAGQTPNEVLDRLTHPPEIQEGDVWRVLYTLTEFELFRLADTPEELRLPG